MSSLSKRPQASHGTIALDLSTYPRGSKLGKGLLRQAPVVAEVHSFQKTLRTTLCLSDHSCDLDCWYSVGHKLVPRNDSIVRINYAELSARLQPIFGVIGPYLPNRPVPSLPTVMVHYYSLQGQPRPHTTMSILPP